jgi:hypothetical protein
MRNWKMLLGDFSARVGKEDILKSTNGNEILCETSMNNGVREVNLATYKICQEYNIHTLQNS